MLHVTLFKRMYKALNIEVYYLKKPDRTIPEGKSACVFCGVLGKKDILVCFSSCLSTTRF